MPCVLWAAASKDANLTESIFDLCRFMLCCVGLSVDGNVSEKYVVSVFRAEYGDSIYRQVYMAPESTGYHHNHQVIAYSLG
jgi:hypothetical protein